MLDDKKTARLEARLPVAIHSLLKEAADLQGRSLSDFVVASAREAAERAIARSSEIQLSRSEQKSLTVQLHVASTISMDFTMPDR